MSAPPPAFLGEIAAAAAARRAKAEAKAHAEERVGWDHNVQGLRRRFHSNYRYVMLGADGMRGCEGVDVPDDACAGRTVLSLAQTDDDIGTTVYTAAVQTSRFLEHSWAHKLRDKRVLELGSGTGLVGMVACMLGADVVLTDLEGPCMRNLRRNAELLPPHARARCTCAPLAWGTDSADVVAGGRPFDIILACEVVYEADLVAPLVATLKQLCAAHRPSEVLWAYDLRGRPGLPAARAQLAELFDMREVSPEECAPGYCCQHVKLVVCTPKVTDGS